jgi:hypothetical protein
LLAVLTNPAFHFKRFGLEAGPLSQWLFSVSPKRACRWICVETRHMRAALKARSTRRIATKRGIVQMMRVGLYRPVHVEQSMAIAIV